MTDIDIGIGDEIERIRQIYCLDVLQHSTRPVELLGRKCSPRILYTFLGFELKAGRKRIDCPDKVTARYLKVFAELGFREVRLPYDPSRTAILVTGLEHALGRIQELLLAKKLSRPQHQQRLRRIYAQIRKKCACTPD